MIVIPSIKDSCVLIIVCLYERVCLCVHYIERLSLNLHKCFFFLYTNKHDPQSVAAPSRVAGQILLLVLIITTPSWRRANQRVSEINDIITLVYSGKIVSNLISVSYRFLGVGNDAAKYHQSRQIFETVEV